ncbi:hypothetical protein BDP27DRAFT_1315931 [Rhodocollybia butyracea]|uniref:Uncharacterized protein n=1 Tax=Rhodocollybia butyracea TaxID=206335 RepID=A0A9P5Q743_9AGAR|nr:hypothetical protein BDP27DRAFT_1315931 [Rhodocollybia butyracea]
MIIIDIFNPGVIDRIWNNMAGFDTSRPGNSHQTGSCSRVSFSGGMNSCSLLAVIDQRTII